MVERGTALLRKMEINVAEAEKRTGKNTVNMQETYTVYLIETRYGHLIICHVIAVVFEKCASNSCAYTREFENFHSDS